MPRSANAGLCRYSCFWVEQAPAVNIGRSGTGRINDLVATSAGGMRLKRTDRYAVLLEQAAVLPQVVS